MYSLIKRSIDLSIIIITLPIWLPTLLLICLIVYIFYGRPFIFSQKRLGFKGENFSIYKIKTMNDKRDSHNNLLDDSKRVTRVGRILRKMSLDELPSIINVLRGDMSLVGPRPFIAQYKNLYNESQMKRHNVKPGITGWAQVSGRNNLSWEEKFKLDVWYVENQSLKLDLKILFITIWTVIRSDGISNKPDVTMPFFTGSKHKKDVK